MRLRGRIPPATRDFALHRGPPNIVSVMGYLLGMFPPGQQDESAWLAVNEVLVDAHRRAVGRSGPTRPASPPGWPSRWPISRPSMEARRRGTRIGPGRRTSFCMPLRATTSSASRPTAVCGSGPTGCSVPNGVEVLALGYEYWPEALGATIREHGRSPKERFPILVTENGIGTDDDAAAYPVTSAPPSAGSWTASQTASTCSATPTGRSG